MVRAFSDETADLVCRDKGSPSKSDDAKLASIGEVVQVAAGDTEKLSGFSHRIRGSGQRVTCHHGAILALRSTLVNDSTVL
jgi:hypothetical protein